MKRKDFLRSCLVLGIVPFMPKISGGQDIRFYGSGFRHKKGICYGFWSEDEGEVELLIFDYQRIPYDKKVLECEDIRKTGIDN